MPDIEGMEIDIAQARGESAAAMSMMAAIVAALVRRGHLDLMDVATLTAHAKRGLGELTAEAPEVREMGESAIRGFARSVTVHLRND